MPGTQLSTLQYETMITSAAEKETKKKVSKKSHGVDFKNENPELIDLFDKLTTRKYPRTSWQYESSCTKVICAVKEIFGNDEGPRILYMLQKYELNSSHLSFRDTSPWHTEELNELIAALEDLPDGLLPLDDNKSFVRMKRGYTWAHYNRVGECVEANSEIRFFDCWSEAKRPKHSRMGTVAHELGHYIASELGLSNVSEWNDISGWERKLYEEVDGNLTEEHTHKENACFLSTYGQESPSEDFAEAFVAYRYTPKVLKENCPEKYRFIKELVFNGVEFTKDKKFCENRPKVENDSGLYRFFKRKISFW